MRKYDKLETKLELFDKKKVLENANGNKNLYRFAQRLCKLLDINNLNESDLCRETGISKASINAYVKAEQIPSVEKLIIIAKFFKVSSDYLLGLSDTPTLNKDFKVINNITGLSDKSIEILQLYNDLKKDDKIPLMLKDDAVGSLEAIDLLIKTDDYTGIFGYIARYLWNNYQSNYEQLEPNGIMLKTTNNRNVLLKTSDINKIELITIEEKLRDLRNEIFNQTK